jgi:secreted Zn-dependent insulinase-like peptidase
MNVIADMFQYFRPDNCIIMLKDKAFAGKTACKEEQYGTEYNIRSITEQEMTHWTSKAMNVAGSNDDQLAPLLALPTPNPFVATNFDLKCGSAAAPAAAEESAPAATALLFVGPDQLYRTDCLELSDAAPATEPSAVMPPKKPRRRLMNRLRRPFQSQMTLPTKAMRRRRKTLGPRKKLPISRMVHMS